MGLFSVSCVQMFANDKIDHLSSFAKIYGIVRYYSPNPYTQTWDETDWFKVAYRYVKSYQESDCDEAVLYDFLNVFAPDATLTAAPDSVYSSEISSPFYFNEYVGSDNMLLLVSYLPYQRGMYYVSEPEVVRHKSKIDKTCVFLSDYTSMSYAETVLMIVDSYDLGTIIGRPTRGTNGDATRFMLPAFGFTMTGLKAVNFDGSRHHGIGVIPDITVEPTTMDYARNGRDIIFERAEQYLKGNLSFQ